MKFGVRKPSLRKSISARTTGRAKRAVKKALIPGYGKKGTGVIKTQEKRCTTKLIIRQPFQFLIYSNNNCPTFGAFI